MSSYTCTVIGTVRWAPSQNGALPDRLHMHIATCLGSARENLTGVQAVPLCEPSQKGCFSERPQAHQKYVPASSIMTAGCEPAAIASDIRSSFIDRHDESHHWSLALSPAHWTDKSTIFILS